MLKRQGVKRSHVKAQVVSRADGAKVYRTHLHLDVDATAKPVTMLAKIGDMIATGFRAVQAFFGFGGGRIPFLRVRGHQFLRSVFPHLTGDYASPTPPAAGALFGREAHRAQRRRFRERWQHRAAYRKARVELRPEGEYGENLRAGAIKHVMGAAMRAGLLIPAIGDTRATGHTGP